MSDYTNLVKTAKGNSSTSKVATTQPPQIERSSRSSLQPKTAEAIKLKRLNVEIPETLHKDLQRLSLALDKTIKELVTQELSALIDDAKGQNIID